MIPLGKTARRIRESKKLTQKTAAEALGITTVYLSQIENDKAHPSQSILDRYKELWGVDLYILAWCLYGNPDDLPAPVRKPMRELAKVWIEQLGDLIPSERDE
jgi:transcriptional regulator with XRE-family HTH domain